MNYFFFLLMKFIFKFFFDDDLLRDIYKFVRKYFKVEKEEVYYSGVVRFIVVKNDKD